MKTISKSLLFMMICFAGLGTPVVGRTCDTQWTYKTIDGKALKMDVFLPEGYAFDELSFPTIVFYHGGGWSGGKVSWHHPDCAHFSKGGKHGFCIGTKVQNHFYYWSLELVDAFLVKHGILTGENLVIRPVGVEPLKLEEFEAYY